MQKKKKRKRPQVLILIPPTSHLLLKTKISHNIIVNSSAPLFHLSVYLVSRMGNTLGGVRIEKICLKFFMILHYYYYYF